VRGLAHKRRGWGRLLGLGSWRSNRGIRAAATLGQGWTGLGSIKSSRSSYLGARRRAAGGGGVLLGAGREAGVTAGVDIVGQAGSEQVGRAARSHNLLERHLDSIKEGRL
jgi:hypothetical protein